GIDNMKFQYFSDKIKLRSILGIPKKHKVFLFIGKFIEQKGIQHLLEAVNILKNDYHDFTVLLIGRGHLEKFLKKWVYSQKIENYVKFLGWIDNDQLPPYYGMADAVIVPSSKDKQGTTDGLPVVVQESLAAGVPVIASSISGISEIIQDHYNGWLFEPGNHGDLYCAMKMVYKTDKNTIKQIREDAVKSAEIFSYKKVAEKYFNEIQKLIF
ncbi:glycosyltransferase family 4 protein, partial [bacterium]|nr:glycosyltransferase family 4 protein [bacterium]